MKQASKEFKEVVLIGAGNLSTHLGKNLYKKGYKISQVFSKSKDSANTLSKVLKAEPITDFSRIKKDSDFYFICLKDDLISKSIKKIPTLSGIVIHTSGSVNLNVLSSKFENCGVLYPIQTFNKHIKKLSFSNIPLCIEANNEFSYSSIKELANHLSENVRDINSKQRQTIHLAAVFSCNFVNYLFEIADNLLKKEKIDISLLYPLIEQTIAKIKTNAPAEVQTGPAVRNDIKTIEEHLKLLENEKKYQEIYRLLTENIINSHQK